MTPEIVLSPKEEVRIAAIWATVGSMAHVGVGVEDLHREGQADKRKEEAQEPCHEWHGYGAKTLQNAAARG